MPPPPALPAAPGVAASVAAQPRAASRRYEARARGEPALGPSALFPDTPGPVGACRGGRRRGATGKASLAPAMHLSWARGAAAGTHPLTERSARGAEEKPLPSLPPSQPSARTVDKSPLQQPLIKDVAGGGCAPETNVPDALLLSALVFTESQAGIRFPQPPPPPRWGD